MAIGRSAPRYQMMGLLYRRSKTLQSYLSEYFVVVVGLCHQLLKFSQKSKFGQFASAVSNPNMGSYQSELDVWANAIKEEVNLQVAKTTEEEAQENSRMRTLSRKFLQSKSVHQRMKTKIKLLDLCSVYDYETTWKQTRKVGNATLFSRSLEYQAWKDRANASRSTLICTGKLGCGKSVLLANIVDDLNLHFRGESITVAYFFCRHDNPDSLKARTIIGSLARQLLRPIPDLSMASGFLDETASALDFNGIFGLLKRSLPSDCKVSFILDGLDECDSAELDLVVEVLQRLQNEILLLLCISLRLEPSKTAKVSPARFKDTIIFSIPEENPDIELFIQAELEDCIQSTRLVVGNPALIVEIQSTLLEGSQGMFLWAALQIESLCTMSTDGEIRDALVDLPSDLSETFSRILRKSKGLGAAYQRRILELVSVARRPLAIEELREALSVVPGDTVWNPARLLNDVHKTIGCCGCLLSFDEEDLTVRLMHHSVKQYILSGSKNSTDIPFTIESAERKMADVILTYLSYGVFETRLSAAVAPQIETGSAPSTIIRSTLDSSNSIQSLALKFLKSRATPGRDIGSTLAETSKLLGPRSVDGFHFLPYAKLYWFQHISCSSDPPPADYEHFLKVSEGKMVITNITALILAIRTGREALIKAMLAADDLDVNATDKQDSTPLSWAVKEGRTGVVALLLANEEVYLDCKDSQQRTPLSLAARLGHKAIVQLLLTSDKVDVDSKDLRGRTPLSMVIRQGNKAIVKLLLDTNRVDINSKDNEGRTPISWAAGEGRKAVIKLLLSTGKVDVNSEDYEGRTPLSWAKRRGHKPVVKMLSSITNREVMSWL
ncbi:MAG: hypothetical protein Q9157_001442 [Trypethelium eluteriae]